MIKSTLPRYSPGAIDPGATVADILARHPEARAVLQRFGLDLCCGGAHPLEFACRAHGVSLDEVLSALRAALPITSTPAAQPGGHVLYRRFLKTALLFTFTGGTALGAWALILMARRGELGGMGRGLMQVHGHYQLFGWVGLFVVGVAYQILPRMTGVALPSYRQASASFALLAAGAFLRFAQSLDPSPWRSWLLVGGGLLEVAGAALFLASVLRILQRHAARPEPWAASMALGSGWFVAAAMLNLTHTITLAARSEFEVPSWLNVPYLTVFLLGFVTFWILGVSLRALPTMMGLRVQPGLAGALILPLTLGVAALALGEGLTLGGAGTPGRLVMGMGGLGVAGCLATFVVALGVLQPPALAPPPGTDRGHEKFLRLGYAWLLLSGLALAVFSVLALTGTNMNHAFVGAYRHALTVGFITTVMVGMAGRLVPAFAGVPLYSTRLREASFWLLACGNVLRVLFQGLSAVSGPTMLRVAGISGVLELAGLLLFGINIWKTMDAGSGRAHPVLARTAGMACLALGLIGVAPAQVGDLERPLGTAHVAVKGARLDFSGDAAAEWGLDQEHHVSLEVYGALDSRGRTYFGGELGRTAADDFTDPQGDRLTDISVSLLEVNEKAVFDLEHGLAVSVGGGSALILVSAEEQFDVGGTTESSPLDDIGFGLQVFSGLDWRFRRLLLGVEAKYQYAFDLLNLDYSNLRFGARIGLVF